jgi:hypothetical protein
MTQLEADRIVGGAAFLSMKIPLLTGRIFILPHGPLSRKLDDQSWDILMRALDEHFRARGAIYVQTWPPVAREGVAGLEPFLRAGYQWPALFRSHNFSSTLLAVDLAGRPEKEILASFRHETRHNYYKSLKRGVRLHLGTSHEDLRRCYNLIEENARYHGYEPRPYNSLAIAFDRLVKKDRGLLIEAWKGDELAGAIMVLFAGGTASYIVGATLRSLSKFCPSEFLHVSAMCLARDRGMAVYDLVNPGMKGDQFKRGFRPRVCRWIEPRTKVFKPHVAQCLSWAERRFRPLIRQVTRWRANQRRAS